MSVRTDFDLSVSMNIIYQVTIAMEWNFAIIYFDSNKHLDFDLLNLRNI